MPIPFSNSHQKCWLWFPALLPRITGEVGRRPCRDEAERLLFVQGNLWQSQDWMGQEARLDGALSNLV